MSDARREREWYGASDIAGLPGMPGTERGVRARADRENWNRRTREARGGGYEYALASLPATAREALMNSATTHSVASPENPATTSSPPPSSRDLGSAVASAAPFYSSAHAKAGMHEGAKLALRETINDEALHGRRLESLAQSITLDTQAQARIDAKLAILRALEEFRAAHRLTQERAEHAFAHTYNEGGIDLPAARAIVARLGARTLRAWRGELKRDGLTRLAGAYGNRKGTSKIDTQPAVRDYVLGVLVAKPHARASYLLEGMRARFADSAIALPSLRSLERWMADWKRANAQTFAYVSNPDAWRNQYMVAHGSRSADVLRLNQRWELDSTPADVMLTDGRHAIIGVIDVYTRRAKLLVAKTSKGAAIATLVRHALLDWGVPEEAKTDNGQDYTGRHLTRVFGALDIQQTLCPPFSPDHKPHIESFFRTFSHDLVELLDGFIGHNVAERKAIEARRSFAARLMESDGAIDIKLSAVEFQNFCDRWCEDVYQHRQHSDLGKSPFEMASTWREPVRRVTNERALDILLAEAPDNHGMRTVQKKGIAINGAWFIAPELEAHVGQQVQVRHDALDHDFGRVYVFGGPDLQFVCIAECPERTGVDQREVAIRAKQIQKKRLQDERRALKAVARSVNADEIVNDILRERAIESGKLALFPARHEVHESAGLTAAADAAAALDRPARTTADLMPAAEFAAARARIEAQSAQPVQPIFNTPFDRAYWLAEQARLRDLSMEEREYLHRFRNENKRSAHRLDQLLEARYGAKHGPAAAG